MPGESYIERQGRRGNRNLLLVNGPPFLLLVVLLALSARVWFNFVFGPFRVAPSALVEGLNSGKAWRYYVEVPVAAASPLQVGVIWKQTGPVYCSTAEPHDAEYYAVPLEGRLLLVKLYPDQRPPAIYDGKVQPLTRQELAEVLSKNPALPPDLAGQFFPAVLDTTSIHSGEWTALFWLTVPFLIFTLNTLKGIARFVDRRRMPAMRVMGQFGDPATIAAEIESDLAAGDTFRIHAGCMVTRHWLIKEEIFGIDLVRITDVVWISRTDTVQRPPFRPPVHRSAALLMTRSGKAYLLANGTQEFCDGAIAALQAKSPFILVGGKEIPAAWAKDRGAVLAEFDRRREKGMSTGSVEQGAGE